MLAAQIFNGLEAAFWLALAVLSATAGGRVRGFTPRRQLALTIFLTAFGVSNIWEVFSRWSQPASLLVFKAACIAGLAITAARIYGTRWRLGGWGQAERDLG